MGKTVIYFVRHGEVHNPTGILYGRLPRMRLSTKGQQEAQRSGQFLNSKKIAAIYSSPLLRARQTAELIGKELEIERVSYRSNLLEVLTHFQGQLMTDLRGMRFDFYESSARQPGDESMPDIFERMMMFCREASLRHKGQEIVAVSHGDPLMILEAGGKGLPLVTRSIRPEDDSYIKHAEVLTVEMSNGKIVGVRREFYPSVPH